MLYQLQSKKMSHLSDFKLGFNITAYSGGCVCKCFIFKFRILILT